MANEIWSYVVHIVEGLVIVLASVLMWVWGNDRKESRGRIDNLEVKVSDLQVNHVTRVEFHDKVDQVQKVFREDHKDIFSAISESNKTLREDISELRHMMMAIIGRRDEDSH